MTDPTPVVLAYTLLFVALAALGLAVKLREGDKRERAAADAFVAGVDYAERMAACEWYAPCPACSNPPRPCVRRPDPTRLSKGPGL